MEKQPRYFPGDAITGFPTEDVNAGTLVMIAADKTTEGDYKVKPCGENKRPVGMATRSVDVSELADTDIDKRVPIYIEGVLRIKAAAGITAGEEVFCSGAGEVKKLAAEKTAIGLCLATVTTGNFAEIMLYQ